MLLKSFLLFGSTSLVLLTVSLALANAPAATSDSGREAQYQKAIESRKLQKKRVRDRAYPGAHLESELTVQTDLTTSREKRRQERQERRERQNP